MKLSGLVSPWGQPTVGGGALAWATRDDEEWMGSALCAQVDPELFFPEKGGNPRDAKRVCVGCPVIEECREYALKHNERFGVWGGLSERARAKLRRTA